MASLPSNVHVSTHPCLLAKLSQLRSATTTSKETKALVHEISLLLAAEALGKFLTTSNTGEVDYTPLSAPFEVQKVTPTSIALVPVLRSGLGMLEGAFVMLSPLFVSELWLTLFSSFRDAPPCPGPGAPSWPLPREDDPAARRVL